MSHLNCAQVNKWKFVFFLLSCCLYLFLWHHTLFFSCLFLISSSFFFFLFLFSSSDACVHVIEPEPGAGSRPGVQYLNKLSAQFSARTAGKQLCLCFCTRLFDLLPHAYNLLLLQSMYWILHFTFSDHTLILDALRGFHLFISVVYNQSTNRKAFLIRAVTLVCRTVVSDIISYQVAWKLIFKHPLSARSLPVLCSGWFNFTSICGDLHLHCMGM